MLCSSRSCAFAPGSAPRAACGESIRTRRVYRGYSRCAKERLSRAVGDPRHATNDVGVSNERTIFQCAHHNALAPVEHQTSPPVLALRVGPGVDTGLARAPSAVGVPAVADPVVVGVTVAN